MEACRSALEAASGGPSEEAAAQVRDILLDDGRLPQSTINDLSAGLNSMLAAYPTTLGDDLALLSGPGRAALSPNQIAAVVLRLGEKKVLLRAIGTVNKFAVPAE